MPVTIPVHATAGNAKRTAMQLDDTTVHCTEWQTLGLPVENDIDIAVAATKWKGYVDWSSPTDNAVAKAKAIGSEESQVGSRCRKVGFEN